MGVLSAKMYVGSLRDNVIRSQEYKREQGQWQSCAPVGYLIYFISRKGSGNSFENGRYSVLVDV